MPKKNRKKVVSENYMDKIPVRSASRPWRVTEDGMVEIDMENNGFYHRIAQKYFKKPKVSHIALDTYGTTVWINIDGTNTIYDILTIMETTFPKEKDKMLNRVVAFMTTLETNHFVDMR